MRFMPRQIKPFLDHGVSTVRRAAQILLQSQHSTRRLQTIMTSPSNIAAWQLEPKGPLTVKEANMYEPGPGEIRIKIYAAPIQPAEAKQFYNQVMPRFKYPGILGSQCAGIVDALGANVTKVAVGDRVASSLNNYANGGEPAKASLQRYTIAEEYEVIRIGSDISFVDAVAVNTQTPCGALFAASGLGMERPSGEGPEAQEGKGKKILIWGGSSAMGALSICYAKLAGYEVVTTCSEGNFGLVKERGADHVFDRNHPDVVRKVSELLPIDYWFDTISLPESIGRIIEIAKVQYEREGKEIKLVTLLPATKAFSPGMPELPVWLKAQMNMFRNKAEENSGLVEWMNGVADKPGYLEKGIRGGWIRGVPGKSIGNLEKAEEGIKMVHTGKNSGVKIVIEPWLE